MLGVAAAALPRYAHLVSSGGEAPRVCEKVLDISPDRYCVIAGTVYKEMKLKPCILDEYNKTATGSVTGAAAASAAATTANGGAAEKHMSADDALILEDEFGRVSLTGDAAKGVLDVKGLASGIVVAVLGREVAGGKFEVEAVFLPGLAPQKPLLATSGQARALQATQPTSAAPAYLLCVSGLSFGTPGADPMPVQLLMDYITGLLGSSLEQQTSARIVRVLVAGNSLHRFEKKKALGRDFAREEVDAAEVAQPLKELDLLLTQLAAAVPVDILPGDQDPSNFTLPQQPFHRCLFPSASTYSTFKATTNPTWLEVGDLQSVPRGGRVASLVSILVFYLCER